EAVKRAVRDSAPAKELDTGNRSRAQFLRDTPEALNHCGFLGGLRFSRLFHGRRIPDGSQSPADEMPDQRQTVTNLQSSSGPGGQGAGMARRRFGTTGQGMTAGWTLRDQRPR